MKQTEKLIKEPTKSLNVRQRRLRKARQLLEHLQTKHGSSTYRKERAYLWEALGAAWFCLGNVNQVEQCLTQMASLQPGCADAYLNLGNYLSEMGLTERAKQAYLEGLKVNPADQYIIYNLVEHYRANGQQHLALQAIDKAILASPNSGVLLKAKADLLLDWGHPGMAALTYELALPQLDAYGFGLRQEALHSLAAAYQTDGNTQAAITTWEQALENSQSDLKAAYNLILLHCQEQNWCQIIQLGQRYLQHGAYQTEVRRLMFRAYQALAHETV